MSGETPPTVLEEFRALRPYPLDPFQIEACEAIERGENALVVAPTGSGKTLVAEYAIHRALARGKRVFYTTPLKALSNQKHTDLSELYGAERVGLLTGDISLRGKAPVVVMTTEILRNMIYAGSPDVAELDCVILDEAHYLADQLRGPIWEEIIITAPAPVQIVALSATVSNGEELGQWLRQVRGETAVVQASHRPVPLYNHVLYNGRLLDLVADDGVSLNPAIRRQQLLKDHRRSRPVNRSRASVVQELDRAGLLPAIYFIFSRAGCEAAAQQCLQAGLRLMPPANGRRNVEVLKEHCAELPPEDLAALGYPLLEASVERGFAPHHAGLLPAFRLTVERLFAAGQLRAVFATETLALGINMPARTVVLDRLDKWNGTSHEDLTPGEYIQLTGRAGRRGIDLEGHAVVSTSGQQRAQRQLALATARPGPLISAFKPSYNMAVNLLATAGVERAHALLESSFAQFQADRSVVGLAAQVRRHEAEADKLRPQLTCERGDLPGYFALREQLSRLEDTRSRALSAQRSADKEEFVARLRPGDVIWIPRGRWKGHAIVLDAKWDGKGRHPRRLLLTEAGDVRDIEIRQLGAPLHKVGQVRVRSSFNPRVPAQRRDLLSSLRALERSGGWERPALPAEAPEPAAHKGEIEALRAELRAHPCHSCPDMARHESIAHRLASLDGESAAMRERIDKATDSLARAFDRICAVLQELRFVTFAGDDVHLSADGERLRSIYADHDLLLALALREDNPAVSAAGGLSPAACAAVLSGLIVERRSEAGDARLGMVPGPGRAAIGQLQALHGELARREAAAGVPERRPLDFSLAGSVFAWLEGSDLALVLGGAEISAGDFLRSAGQLEDLLGQLRRLEVGEGAPGPLGSAHDLVRGKLAAFRR